MENVTDYGNGVTKPVSSPLVSAILNGTDSGAKVFNETAALLVKLSGKHKSLRGYASLSDIKENPERWGNEPKTNSSTRLPAMLPASVSGKGRAKKLPVRILPVFSNTVGYRVTSWNRQPV